MTPEEIGQLINYYEEYAGRNRANDTNNEQAPAEVFGPGNNEQAPPIGNTAIQIDNPDF